MSVVHGTRWGARHTVVGALLAALCLASPATAGAASKSASDIAPIIGQWSSAGAVINVTGGGGSFQGTVVSGSFANCPNLTGPGTVIWKNVQGSGFSYTGKIPWVQLPDCTPLGDGNTTFTLSSINSGSLTSTSPDGSKTEGASMTRVGTWPGATNKPKTKCKKNGHVVPCPQQRTTLRSSFTEAKKTLKATKRFNAADIQTQTSKLGQLVALSTQAGQTTGEWLTQKLPTTKRQAKAKFGGSVVAKGWNFLEVLSDFNAKLAALGDQFYSQPEPKSTLDDVASSIYRSPYNNLTVDQKASVFAFGRSNLSKGGAVMRADPQTGEVWVPDVRGGTDLYVNTSVTDSNDPLCHGCP